MKIIKTVACEWVCINIACTFGTSKSQFGMRAIKKVEIKEADLVTRSSFSKEEFYSVNGVLERTVAPLESYWNQLRIYCIWIMLGNEILMLLLSQNYDKFSIKSLRVGLVSDSYSLYSCISRCTGRFVAMGVCKLAVHRTLGHMKHACSIVDRYFGDYSKLGPQGVCHVLSEFESGTR